MINNDLLTACKQLLAMSGGPDGTCMSPNNDPRVTRNFALQAIQNAECRSAGESYFDTLEAALNAVDTYMITEEAHTRDDWRSTFQGGLAYGETRHTSVALTACGGVVCSTRRTRGLYVAIYRMESGRYELTRYIA